MLGSTICLAMIFCTGFAVTRFIVVLREIFCNRKTVSNSNSNTNSSVNVAKSRKSRVKTMIVIGSGGHTSEMLRLMEPMSSAYEPRRYIMADTDKMSEEKVISFEKAHRRNGNRFDIKKIYRSREVGQSWLTSVLSTFYSSVSCVPLVFTYKPDLILCNGPGTCIPICLIAFILRVLLLRRCVIIYIESICRVKSLSLSGHLLYHFADHLLVQWPELCTRYPHAEFIGRLV